MLPLCLKQFLSRVVLGLPNSFLITVAASQAVVTIMCCSRATQFLYLYSDAFASCLDCSFPLKILFESYRKRAVYQVWQSKHIWTVFWLIGLNYFVYMQLEVNE